MFCKFLHIHRFKSGRKVGSSGFSLIELMIIIAIVGIIAGIGYPSLMKSRTNARTRGVASDIFASLRMAKVEAVKRNINVCLEFTVPNTYMAFLDNGEGGGAADDCIQNGSEPTFFTKTVEPGTSLSSVAFPPAPDTATGFNSRGLPYNGIGNIVVQNDSNPQLQYKNTVSIAGRVGIQVTTDGTWPP